MDVGGWLRNLGLGKHEAAFHDNAIDEQVLRHLTAEDLKEIGVATVGDRRKLLAAIAELATPSPSAEPRSPPRAAQRLKTSEVAAERRPITVMFCDLVGSTALASRLDAEDWRTLVNAYLDEASGAVNRLGGHVLKRLGDGLMALFGYPHAQENDAERAVRAALAVQRALGEMNARNAAKGAPQLSARIGLESGPVVLQALAERGAQAPLLILATARPEFRPPWSLRSHHSVIALSPLDRADIARMVSELAAHNALSREVVEGVSERSGGVPLFVEEVTRLLLERGEAGGLHAIPPTLQQSLAARLDRLGEAREVAQIGAVLGRDFTSALLSAVGEIGDPALQSALDRLAGADLLIVEGAGAHAIYRFKHALIQDAAYDSLLKSRRQALHSRAAELLRDQPERVAAEPEAIAHHFTEANLDDLAIEWWGKAGDSALRRSAFQEAVAHLGRAIAMSDKAGGGKAPGALARRQQFQVTYGNALFHARGYGAPETAEAFARARESAVGDKGASERLKIDYALWAGSFARGELQSMRAHTAAFLRDVSDRPDSPEAGVAHRCAGTTHLFVGEYQEARVHLEQALALFQPGRDDNLADRFGQDAGVSAMFYLALVLWPMGDSGRAISLVRDAKARTATLTHIGARAYGMCLAAIFELVCGNLSRAAPHAAELARLAHEHDLLMWRAYGIFLGGAPKAEGRTLGRGLRDMRRGAELLREQKVRTFDGLAKITLAEAEARAGDIDRALAILDETLATSERTGNRQFDAELHRGRGEMLLKRDPTNPVAAQEALLTAIAVSKQQSTRSFELCAALSLARLYQSTGRSVEGHAVLAPALEGFAPTPEMPEIAEAQALLERLA